MPRIIDEKKFRLGLSLETAFISDPRLKTHPHIEFSKEHMRKFDLRQRELFKKGKDTTSLESLELRKSLYSSEQKFQDRLDHADFMQMHKDFTYNCFTAHLIG